MIKLAKWLWDKAERNTADRIIQMMLTYWRPPQHPGNDASEEEALRYQAEVKSWKDAHTVIEMIRKHYLPEKGGYLHVKKTN